ncbi:hypothetical protein BT63DRAFT_372312 [Microthyrium microscopicum]|uniref:Uncharacterized protein n=1 Tax=Microthyrium microscopicum TaxID=703497 RepID=A0A6A6UG86_9PEZI|nr:hypothetical protein BT63DRAFT_372312 [Microthyrium microscopicum]
MPGDPRSSLADQKNSHLFNIPKKGAPRPEHGRPPPQSSRPVFRMPGDTVAPPWIAPAPPGPTSSLFTSRPAPTFSSLGGGGFQPINVRPSVPTMPQASQYAANDSDSEDGFDPDAALRNTSFGAQDPFMYVDPEKASEDIKGLLEGAFDDEDDENFKPRLRRSNKVVKAVKDATKSLADKLKTLDVNDKKEEEKEEEEEEEETGVVDGLKVKLLPHQIAGVAWMQDKESGKKEKKNGRQVIPNGGILADDMGLGKTIQALSLIILHSRPTNDEIEQERKDTRARKPRIPLDCSGATLVVAPLALIRQWQSEIETKCDSLRVLVHHGPSRTKSATKLKSYDVVVTTYQTLTSEHAAGSKTGCFGVNWYRIILDEAHSIKNRNAKMTQACYALESAFRWCLTGTPMQNNLDELQSLIRFLRIKPYCDYTSWKQQIITPLKNGRGFLAMRRLQVFLTAFMKRRTKDVMKKEGALGEASEDGKNSNGFKIVERKIENISADFSDHERTFYARLESRANDSLKEMMSGEKQNYMGALVLLLRLRQACNHPQLMRGKIERDKDAMATGIAPQVQQTNDDKDVDDIADMLGGLSVKTQKCDVCKSALTKEETSKGQLRCEDCEQDLQEELGMERLLGKVKKESKKALKSLKKKERKEERAKLRAARARQRRIIDSDDEDEEGAEGEWIVPKTKQSSAQDGELHTDDEDEEKGGQWLGSEDSQTDDDDDEDDEDDESSEEEISDEENSPHLPFANLTASTKITHLLNILKTETPEHKVIVFSEFTSMLDIIEPFLQGRYKFARYDGSMKNDMREESLRRLREDKRCRVLLCSLKCGSLGLNLTAASRVVLMEPFWNPFVEEQAIDRVHRLNQTKDVTVYRLTIAGTVEERILQLQEAKRALAKAALEGGKSMAKLNMADIIALFKPDAEHQVREYDGLVHVGQGAESVRVLLDRSKPVFASDGSARPRDGNAAGKVRREEHPVYGRR